ncbi:quorum sensing histidine kinase QseC [Basfia succiniciproducens]|uniref:Sensor protein QseC n=1 Tax=Basfia succiniciproducens TaxID=653940 RepID=A0A1G5AFM7_9PAST|nr:quorum sensing histidine kinase QseC [Basfia succiniciproducens]QIM68585.1 two-component system sensor histidine kinase QseC [Basfia succiniciproducens]SCX76698.1 two-component system, OmpR family, sensor histidine kinase QseC [Basfia succiniciproducens]
MNLLKMNSIRLRLIVILSFIALVIWGVTSALNWHYVRQEVNNMFDIQQILLAKRLSSSSLQQILHEQQRERNMRGRFARHLAPLRAPMSYDDDALAFAIFTRSGEMLVSDDANGAKFQFAPDRGFTETKLSEGNESWRIFWLPSKDKNLIIAVGQEMDYRNNLINNFVLGQMWIWIASLPLLIGLIIFVIHHELRLLNRVSVEVRERSPEDNHLIDTADMPTEVLPLLQSLNGYFARTAETFRRERRFTSDAAHELRSPLAALRIQTEVAQMLTDEPELQTQALDNLTKGIDRASQLIEQLLILSRLDNLSQLNELEPIYWEQLIPAVISEQYSHAQQRNIEIKFDRKALPQVKKGQPLLVSLMLRNLIDNCIKYCPEGSVIQVNLNEDTVVIEDNGYGVSDEDINKLGQRFYRPAGQNEKGSGLGLSIVHRIAELHHYEFSVENIKDQSGKCIGFRSIIKLN